MITGYYCTNIFLMKNCAVISRIFLIWDIYSAGKTGSYHRSFAGPAFKRLLKSCGFEDMQWRFLRNTYATVLAEYEISIKAIDVWGIILRYLRMTLM